ncbi:MAG: ATP-dependent DNA helicase RecG, partial [bacterium]|nr:ATP-dependent DNA helicase RecG [bacterium]
KKIINTYLDKYGIYLKEYLPHNVIDKYNIPTLYYMYRYIHNPKSVKEYELAYKRLKYEEFFDFELKLQYSRKENKKSFKRAKKWDVNVIRDFIKTIPFELTDSQKEVVNEIYKDLKSNYPSNRLIEGDVGSGKTIVAALAIYAVALDNYEVCFMAPTEILAYQHYQTLSNIFKDTPLKIEILTSSIKGKKREELLNKIKSHEVDVIIGTHALFTEDIIYDNLGLVITDEQHRFGVKQRQALREKGFNPDVLYLTATPIPRTLAISVFGDMDLSVIKTMPKGRKEIKTKVVLESNLDACLNFIKDELDKGNQAYVISPLIEESKKLDLHDVFETSSMLENKFSNYSIKVLHGKMKQAEKDEIMTSFKNKEFQILVSTTVIEVGIDNPNATIMLIFNAERFGLSQLHQLRGRVGRGDKESYCFLVTNNSDVERLKIIENTLDGFKLSEADLRLRGPGDFFGERQSGLPNFKYGNLINDYYILEDAKEDAYNIIFNDDISNYPILYDKVLKEINSIKD